MQLFFFKGENDLPALYLFVDIPVVDINLAI
jgi:hypothetical protein